PARPARLDAAEQVRIESDRLRSARREHVPGRVLVTADSRVGRLTQTLAMDADIAGANQGVDVVVAAGGLENLCKLDALVADPLEDSPISLVHVSERTASTVSSRPSRERREPRERRSACRPARILQQREARFVRRIRRRPSRPSCAVSRDVRAEETPNVFQPANRKQVVLAVQIGPEEYAFKRAGRMVACSIGYGDTTPLLSPGRSAPSQDARARGAAGQL